MAFVKSITEFDEIFLQIREQHLQFLRLRDIMNATNNSILEPTIKKSIGEMKKVKKNLH